MKKVVLMLVMLGLVCSGKAFGQTSFIKIEKSNAEKAAAKDEEIQNDFFSDFMDSIEAEKKAEEESKIMLKTEPKLLKLRPSQIQEMEKNKAERERLRQKFITLEQEKLKPEEKIQNILEKAETAPLGLYWKISPEELREIGYELEEVEREDYPNSYLVKNSAEKAKGYANIIVSFGENNALWCINAQTTAQQDDPTAKEILKSYDKYFEALSQKYGNPHEHFTPYSYEQEITEGEGEEMIVRKIRKENPRGNPNFLKELQTGKAELYSTFHNSTVGVTLSVYVDENGEGQLVLDYKNLPLMKKEKETFINNL